VRTIQTTVMCQVTGLHWIYAGCLGLAPELPTRALPDNWKWWPRIFFTVS